VPEQKNFIAGLFVVAIVVDMNKLAILLRQPNTHKERIRPFSQGG
jgi:hypothetical protein